MVYEDIPRLYSAIAEWGACILCCLIFPRRCSNLHFILSSAGFLVFQCIFMVLTADVPIVLWIPCMAVAVFAMYTFIFCICDFSLWKAVYQCAIAFLLAEFAASFTWQIECYVMARTTSNGAAYEADPYSFLCLFIMLILYLLIFLVTWHLRQYFRSGFVEYETTWQEMLSVVLVVSLTFIFSNISFFMPNTPFSGQLMPDIMVIRTIVDFAGISIVYAVEMQITNLRVESEIIRMESILKTQYDQYRTYQDSIDMINIKYHDLKHQIQGMKAEMDPEKRKEWIERLENEVADYRPEKETGNAVLDTIISGKTPIIRSMDIKFTCVVDGRLLEFMHVADICTLFGNALDNALEHVVTLRDPEKRIIHLTVSEQRGFVYIMMSNYCEEEIAFANGLPLTTKIDIRNHGFGVKSIRKTAEKYDGSAMWTLQDQMLELKVLIPIPRENAA